MRDSEKRRWVLKVRSVIGSVCCWEEVAGEDGRGWEAVAEVWVQVAQERGMVAGVDRVVARRSIYDGTR